MGTSRQGSGVGPEGVADAAGASRAVMAKTARVGVPATAAPTWGAMASMDVAVTVAVCDGPGEGVMRHGAGPNHQRPTWPNTAPVRPTTRMTATIRRPETVRRGGIGAVWLTEEKYSASRDPDKDPRANNLTILRLQVGLTPIGYSSGYLCAAPT